MPPLTAPGHRDRVGDLADEVGEHDDGERRRRAERVQHRPEHGGVERPPGERAEQADVAGAHQRDRVAHAAPRRGRAQAARAGRARAPGAARRSGDRRGRRAASAERRRWRPRQRRAARSAQRAAAGATERSSRRRPRSSRGRPSRAARGRSAACASPARVLEPGAPEAPRASAAAPPAPPVGSRRVAAAPPSVTSALARRSERGGGAAADEPEQRDVAGEREQLEGRGGERPSAGRRRGRGRARRAKAWSGPPAMTISASAPRPPGRPAAPRGAPAPQVERGEDALGGGDGRRRHGARRFYAAERWIGLTSCQQPLAWQPRETSGRNP